MRPRSPVNAVKVANVSAENSFSATRRCGEAAVSLCGANSYLSSPTPDGILTDTHLGRPARQLWEHLESGYRALVPGGSGLRRRNTC
jgi:hypothetical protein